MIGKFFGLAILGVGITLATGIVHGRLTQRWGPVPDLEEAANELKRLPAEIGDWQLLGEQPIDDATVQILSCAGYVNRQYVNRKSGKTVSIAIMVGPPGPISVHTPEICYSSQAYTIDEPRKHVTLLDKDRRTHSFWTLSFHSDKPGSDRLRVCYAWCAKGVWQASTSPRFEFAGQRSLFKLQIASYVPALADGKVTDPCQDFLAALLQSEWRIGD